MKILALDTSTEACSAALYLDGEVQERYQYAPQKHSELILPMMQELIQQADIALTQLDAIAFGRGPGSFMGVRIAASVTQATAFAADLPVACISSLAALAQGADSSYVCAAIDARMSEIYWGAYTRDESNLVSIQGEERLIAPNLVNAALNDQHNEQSWTGVGSGWDSYAELMQPQLNCDNWIANRFPRASDIALLASKCVSSGELVTAEYALPVYLRDTVAVKKQH